MCSVKGQSLSLSKNRDKSKHLHEMLNVSNVSTILRAIERCKNDLLTPAASRALSRYYITTIMYNHLYRCIFIALLFGISIAV